MTAVAIATKRLIVPTAVEQEILARIDRAGTQICEAELRYKLRWHEHKDGSLLDVLDDMERRGLIESALHFRLTEQGRTALPHDYQPPLRYGSGIPWRHQPQAPAVSENGRPTRTRAARTPTRSQ
jgi:DNA-binding PadR family transcriptional regulator